jgi:hypothetical protein
MISADSSQFYRHAYFCSCLDVLAVLNVILLYNTALYCYITGTAVDVTETVLLGPWDQRVKRAMINALCRTVSQEAVEAALWYEQCHNLQAARQLTMDSEYLQVIPETHRRKLLHEIFLATMPSD